MHWAAAQIHRNLWQRLPYEWRRAALFQAAALLAPRICERPAASLPIIVAGALRAATGLGQSARLCHDALKSCGVPVYGIDLTAALLQSPDVKEFSFLDGRAVGGGGALILHVNAPLVPLAMLALGRGLVADKRVIGYWAWELPKVPDEWRLGVPLVHEIWVPSRFVAEAVQPIAGDRPVRTMAHPVLGANTTEHDAVPPHGRPFTVLTVFNMASSFARKNPIAAIRAFRLAFGDDPGARLVVKFANSEAFPPGEAAMLDAAQGASNVRLVGETIDGAAMSRLFGEADVFLSLHRSEGFGLTIAEAMLRGVPVVATDWSGSVDFLSRRTGLPIGYTLVAARDPQRTYEHPSMVWAEPNIEEAAAGLRALRADRALGKRVRDAARRQCESFFSKDVYAAAACAALGL